MPPMPSNAGGGGMHGPSTFDKWKMGAMLGGSVGLIMGFLFGMSGEQVLAYRLLNESSGGVNILRFGAGPNGPLRTLGQYMLGSGATFGFFMSIGSVIRTEGRSPMANDAYLRARRQPIILSRQQFPKGGDWR
ncbi:subunit of TIM23 translocase complex [Ptychographa xylographoides]|nr:subunit of TIM23 translocase complex [Ptychographa xylographoides]